jgi:hypothetical protein
MIQEQIRQFCFDKAMQLFLSSSIKNIQGERVQKVTIKEVIEIAEQIEDYINKTK